jgi:succinate dehydrogenase / fumarate reductase flavoprotein subunit
VFGKRAGEYAAKYAKDNSLPALNPDEVEAGARRALEPFERTDGEGPYRVQQDLQEMMQDLAGIVRREDEMERALDGIEKLKARAAKVSVHGNREYNAGWHTALDLGSLLTVSELVTIAGIERKESRGAHFRDDYPKKDDSYGKFNTLIRKGPDGRPQKEKAPVKPLPPELQAIIEEMK